MADLVQFQGRQLKSGWEKMEVRSSFIVMNLAIYERFFVVSLRNVSSKIVN